MDHPTPPVLSIIVPTLNEVETLPALLSSLRQQRGVHLELILIDGGSTDQTLLVAERAAGECPFPVCLLRSLAGRGRQFNAGARQATGNNLLFLHADSCFTEPRTLAEALLDFDRAVEARGNLRLAGHFALRFARSTGGAEGAYAFYESKSRLNREGCVHGDQGFWVRREFFQEIGPFATDLPFLEDEYFVAAVREQGEWIRLPGEIHTSARRFECEGLLRRQVLNAMIMNAVAIGWTRFLQLAPEFYRCHGDSGRLDLLSVFRRIRDLFRAMDRSERRRIWRASGAYVRDNGWQLLLALDVWREQRRDLSRSGGKTSLLARFEPWYHRFTDHRVGRLLATGLVRSWFYLTLWLLELSAWWPGRFSRKEREHVGKRD